MPMKTITTLLASVLVAMSAIADIKQNNQVQENDPWDAGWKLAQDYSLKSEFDGVKLRELVKQKERKPAENRKLMMLLLHATVKGDRSFTDLLESDEIPKAHNVNLALWAYDYTFNHNVKSLDKILASLARQRTGDDVDEILALQVIDEWDKSIKAFNKHFSLIDGAGGIAFHGFLTTRAYLFPKKFKEMRTLIRKDP